MEDEAKLVTKAYEHMHKSEIIFSHRGQFSGSW
jgi:DNA-binding transcriptional regulator YhcF (GntR family)